tara:strand:+ start:16735 stop:16899 length:165 start_codon:yes stop_codon:yes gene_type:complete
MNIIRRLIFTHRTNRNLRNRRIVRQARSDAARRGVNTEWKKRGDLCRKQFGGIA